MAGSSDGNAGMHGEVTRDRLVWMAERDGLADVARHDLWREYLGRVALDVD
jgi:hypothetical protein